ncbi:hypothetical protein B0T10DRAFT_610083 [Thelonectria olida]|uniref:LITAF domain-containing protein n=1 Tax=Thelonectria olida TaxID=1576542 RepID=A0A9P8VUT3_9HYPO|nr:hypothetical protein B0T10DRAFT_610083 [Thelonectria olida]
MPSPSTFDAPPSYEYTPTLDQKLSNQNQHAQNLSNSPFSPAGDVQAARFSQTIHTFINDGGLPEVATPDHLQKYSTSASEGLIPVTSSPAAETPTESMVTPLNLLSDQPDTVDCPFCRQRTQTRVKKHPSYMTHVAAGTLFLTTLAGGVAPYAYHWNSNISHYCSNCDAKVAHRQFGKKETQAMGTPDHLRVASKFPPATPVERQKE